MRTAPRAATVSVHDASMGAMSTSDLPFEPARADNMCAASDMLEEVREQPTAGMAMSMADAAEAAAVLARLADLVDAGELIATGRLAAAIRGAAIGYRNIATATEQLR